MQIFQLTYLCGQLTIHSNKIKVLQLEIYVTAINFKGKLLTQIYFWRSENYTNEEFFCFKFGALI